MVNSVAKACSGVIAKGEQRVTTLEDWYSYAAPKSPTQWKDGHSAKENARLWLGGAPELPSGIVEVLEACGDVGKLRSWTAEPEARVRFDDFGGEPANVDVLVKADDEYGPVVIGIEAKVNEPFGETAGKTLSQARGRLKRNSGSKGVSRMRQLAKMFRLDLGRRAVLRLRYQLLTLTAATLAEAQRQQAQRAVVIVHELVTFLTRPEHRDRNASDLEVFLRTVFGNTGSISPGATAGPFRNDRHCRLYFGKAQTVT